MDLADIDVKVLYDFEYTTKDGKQVFIKQGEKLLLIRKTNDDWWQVIRKSGRPFYVPASYVEETNSNDGVIVNKFANNNSNNNNTKIRVNFADVGQRTVDRIIKNRDESQGEVYRSRSCSFESQKAYGVNRKPVVPKRIILEKVSTLFEDTLSTSKDNKLRADSDELNFMKPNFLHVKHQNYPDDEDDEEADYVNLPKVDRSDFSLLQWKSSATFPLSCFTLFLSSISSVFFDFFRLLPPTPFWCSCTSSSFIAVKST